MNKTIAVHVRNNSLYISFKFVQFEVRFLKLCFRDGLVWTMGLTGEIELRFRLPPGDLTIVMQSPGKCILAIKTIDKMLKYVYRTIGNKI